MRLVLALGLFVVTAPAAFAQNAMSQAIDRAITKRLETDKILSSPRSDDAEFLRRVSLDIAGKIPTADEAQAFLDDPDPDKRAKLIDRLLDSSDFGRHFAVIWRKRFMKRDENNDKLDAEPFTAWLAKQFNDNVGWDKIVREMLTADGLVDDQPAGYFFLMNRDMRRVDPNKVVGTTVNLFMGIQMQCAECHNHPFVNDWKRTDFWGMVAFFSRTRDAANGGKSPAITEAMPKPKKGAPPGPPPGVIPLPSATEEGKFEGTVKAKLFEGPEPELSNDGPFRPVFADWLTSKDNPYFARAAVNRLWMEFFGRGIVHPVEDMSETNLPSHPELLKKLADDFAASGFDVKRFIRNLCNSEAYQVTSRPVADNKGQDEDAHFARMKVKAMSADVLYDALARAFGSGDFFPPPAPPKNSNTPVVTQRDLFLRVFDTAENDDDPGESGHGVPQFLRLMNGDVFNKTSPTVDALLQKKLPRDQAVERLFLTALSRRPTPAEQERFQAFLARSPNENEGYRSVLWVLINSAEFVTIR